MEKPIKMFRTVSKECHVKAPATEAWKLYRDIHTYKNFVVQSLPTLISEIDILQGDGSTGTFLLLHDFLDPGLAPDGRGVCKWFKEKYTLVDDEKRVKETELLEGWFLDLGLTLYRTRWEIIEKEGIQDECIIRATIEIEYDDATSEAVANSALDVIQSMSTIMERVAHHLLHNYKC